MNSFDKIIGYEDEKKELHKIMDALKNKEKHDRFGAKLPKGVLIYGEPGLGKTMLAEAFIKECGVTTFSFRKNGDDKECLAAINDAFEKAKEKGTAIIFFDDLDKFCDKDDDCRDCKIFNNIQKNIDGVKDKNVLVLATANDYEKLPDSLVRNGRFDRKIRIKTPESEEAKKIIQHYLCQKRIEKGIDFEDIARMVDYSNCADLETIANDAAILSAYKGKQAIDIDDIASAYLKRWFFGKSSAEKDVDMSIYHEIGHVVVAECLKNGSANFVTINTNSKAQVGGFTNLSDGLRRPELVLIVLGGKAASELFYDGSVASGCHDDLSKAVRLLTEGISNNAILGFSGLDHEYPNLSQSLKMRQEIYINCELERYFYLAKKILFHNKDFYFKLVEALKKKDYLLFSEIQDIRKSSTIETFYAC